MTKPDTGGRAGEAGRVGIKYWPAECWSGCTDPSCPYTHFPSYVCDDGAQFAFRDEAETHNTTLSAKDGR